MATNKANIQTIDGYVIRISPYKENDAMVTVLTADGIRSFSARGVLKQTSKNYACVQPLYYSRFSLSVSASGGSSLKEGMILQYVDGKSDFERLAAISFILELTQKMIEGEEHKTKYTLLDGAMKALNSGFDPLTICMIYFAGLLNVEGYGPNIDECAVCGEKHNIVGFAFKDGGFLCQQHIESEYYRKTSRELKIIRYAFMVGPENYTRIAFEKKECLSLIRDMADHLETLTNTKLNSLLLLAKA